MRLPARPLYLLIVALFLAGAALLRLADPFPVAALRLLGFDLYQRIAPAAASTDRPVVVVDIDEASLKAIGQWPWPRTVMAELVRRLSGLGAATIAFDVLFSEPDQSSPEEVVKRLPPELAKLVSASLTTAASHDGDFAAALAAAPTVLGVTLSDAAGAQPPPPIPTGFSVAGDDPGAFVPAFSGAVGNLPALDQAAKGIGSINWVPDRDQIVRRIPLVFRVGDRYVPSLAAEALRVAQGAGSYILKSSNASGEEAFGRQTGLNHIRIGEVAVPTDAEGGIWLRFRPSRPDDFIPARDVLAGQVPAERIAGRIVLVGTSAAGLLDLRATPIDVAVPGVEIQAQVIEHILSGQMLQRPDYAAGIELVLMLGLGALFALVLPRLSAAKGALLGLGGIGGLLVGGFIAFDRFSLLIDTLYPVLVLILLAIGTSLYTYREAERARARIRLAFQHYVAPEIVDEIIADPSRLELGGEVRELTILFCDVRGFTGISEGMSAAQLTRFVNELLTPLSEVILARRGTIDKYMGDAIMAFWNAPLDDPDHAVHGLAAAEAMQAAMAPLNERWRREAEADGRPVREVRIGIGVNTGFCCVGNLGTAARFDYSAIGDEVNVASRLETLTKEYGIGVIVGESTVRAAGRIDVVEIDRILVRGRSRPTRLFAPLPAGADAAWHAGQKRFVEALVAGEADAAVLFAAAERQAPPAFAAYYERMRLRVAAAALGEKTLTDLPY